MLSSKGHPMHFMEALRGAIPAWKVFTLMASPSLMELQAQVSTSGRLLLRSMKLKMASSQSMFVLAQTPTSTGDFKFPHLLEITTSVTLAILAPGTHSQQYTLTILCGMVRGVVLLVPAANSTTLLGSARHCHNPLPMTLS